MSDWWKEDGLRIEGIEVIYNWVHDDLGKHSTTGIRDLHHPSLFFEGDSWSQAARHFRSYLPYTNVKPTPEHVAEGIEAYRAAYGCTPDHIYIESIADVRYALVLAGNLSAKDYQWDRCRWCGSTGVHARGCQPQPLPGLATWEDWDALLQSLPVTSMGSAEDQLGGQGPVWMEHPTSGLPIALARVLLLAMKPCVPVRMAASEITMWTNTELHTCHRVLQFWESHNGHRLAVDRHVKVSPTQEDGHPFNTGESFQWFVVRVSGSVMAFRFQGPSTPPDLDLR